jgi:nucleoside 2-deoxyribosyltransferase
MSKPRIYLAGPMSGLPLENYPAFNAEAARLRAIGYRVENPAENPVQRTWQAYMRQALTQMLKCDAVALLPDWQRSRGALIENGLAVSLGIPARPAAEFQLPDPSPQCWLCEGSGQVDGNNCDICQELPV